jgi:hypothetical protein
MLLLNRKLTVTALLVGLSLFSSASNSRSSRHYEERSDPDKYSVELIGSYGQLETDDTTIKTKIAAISAEIYFDEIDSTGKPLAFAAFLNKKTSLSLFYSKADTDFEFNNTVDTIEETGTGIGFNYISEEDNYIFGLIYSSSDTTDNEDRDVAESSLTGINIGKYINESSAIEFVYTQSTTDLIGSIFSANEKITTDVAKLSYENLLDFGDEIFIYFAGSASQIKNDGFGVKETNQEYVLTSEVFFNTKTSLILSGEFNSGDDLLSKGRTISAGGTYFMTTKFAVNVIISQFAPDEESEQDETSAFISAIARF